MKFGDDVVSVGLTKELDKIGFAGNKNFPIYQQESGNYFVGGSESFPGKTDIYVSDAYMIDGIQALIEKALKNSGGNYKLEIPGVATNTVRIVKKETDEVLFEQKGLNADSLGTLLLEFTKSTVANRS